MKCPRCGIESEGCVYCPECGMQLMYDSAKTAHQTQSQQGAPPQPPSNTYVYPGNSAYQQPQPVYQVNNQYYNTASHKSRLAALLLAIFLGYFGIHRFYAGKVGTGIIWLFTGGLFGIGCIIDIVLIACGTFKDGNGWPIIMW